MVVFADKAFSWCLPRYTGQYTGAIIRCEAESPYGDRLFVVDGAWLLTDWNWSYDLLPPPPTCMTAHNGLLTKIGNKAEFYCLKLAEDQTCEDLDGDGFYCDEEELIDKSKNLGNCTD